MASPQPASQPHSGERFSDQCVRRLKTSEAPDQESLPTHSPTSHPRRPQGLSTQTGKASWAPTVTLILFPPESWSPAGGSRAMGSLHHPSTLPQHGNPEETMATSTEHLPIRAVSSSWVRGAGQKSSREGGRGETGGEKAGTPLTWTPGQKEGRARGPAGRGPRISLRRKGAVIVVSRSKSFFFLIFLPGTFFSLVGVFLLCTLLWCFSVLYLVWLFLDRDSPQQGEC